MGVDIGSHSGVVVDETSLAVIIREDNVAEARCVLLQYTARLFHQIRIGAGAEEDDCELGEARRHAGILVSTLEQLDSSTTAEELRQMMLGITRGIRDGFDSRVENSELAVAVWGEVINRSYPGAPTPESTEFIGAPRYQGWDLPTEQILYVFGETECFEVVKTSKGRLLDTMLGADIKLSRWTSYSC